MMGFQRNLLGAWLLKLKLFGFYVSIFRVSTPQWYTFFPWTIMWVSEKLGASRGNLHRYGKLRICLGKWRLHSARVGSEF